MSVIAEIKKNPWTKLTLRPKAWEFQVRPCKWCGLRASGEVLTPSTTRTRAIRPERMSLTSLGEFKANLTLASGLPFADIVRIIHDDLTEQALNAPRQLHTTLLRWQCLGIQQSTSVSKFRGTALGRWWEWHCASAIARGIQVAFSIWFVKNCCSPCAAWFPEISGPADEQRFRVHA